jgi:hypothetical protein
MTGKRMTNKEMATIQAKVFRMTGNDNYKVGRHSDGTPTLSADSILTACAIKCVCDFGYVFCGCNTIGDKTITAVFDKAKSKEVD